MSAPERKASVRDWIAVLGGLLGAFMAVLDIQITNSSLQDIQGSLGASLDEGSWISTGYLVAEIIVIPMTGWLSQVFGLRTYLAGTASLFLLFSILCGTATSLPQMIAYRVGQGFCGGPLISTAFTILLMKLPPSKVTIGFALFGISATFAPAIGPSLGGWLTSTIGWHFIFYLNVIPGLVLIGMILYGLDHAPMQLRRLRDGDWAGIVTMAAGLGALEIVLEEGERKDWFGSPLIVDCAVIAAICLTLAVAIELTRKEPFIDLRLLARRGLGMASLCSLTVGIGLYGSIYITPIYLGQIQGYNAYQIGQVLIWGGLPQLLILPLVPRLMARVDARLLVGFGFLLFGISSIMNAYLSHDSGGEQFHLALLVRALGQPFIITPLSSMATIGIPPAKLANASSLYNIMRNLGGSLGIALLATFTTIREQFHFSVIAERMGSTGIILQDRLADLAQGFMATSGDPDQASAMALANIAGLVRRDAFIMAYGDCFYLIGSALLISLAAVLFLPKPQRAAGASGGH